MGPETIAYVLIISSGTSIIYIALVATEVSRGVRVAKGVRVYIDRQVLRAMKRAERYGRTAVRVYERGDTTLKRDIVHPVTKPFTGTWKRFCMLKTGKIVIKRRSISPYLQKLLKRRG